ncbi:hypothetical protein Tco_0985850 [Tanacetum coccineum]
MCLGKWQGWSLRVITFIAQFVLVVKPFGDLAISVPKGYNTLLVTPHVLGGTSLEDMAVLALGGFAAVLAVLVTGASQSRQHVITSSIHIESRKSPTKSLFDVGSSRISIVNVNTEKYHSDVLARSQG